MAAFSFQSVAPHPGATPQPTQGRPERTRALRLAAPFVTERGDAIPNVTVAYQTWGRLDADGANAAFVGHALTGTADAADWWPGLIGPGRVLDPARHFIVCANVLGGCAGTTGPSTIGPDGERLGGRFPRIEVRDMARLHGLLLDHLGVTAVQLALGGSMGGMQALELALTDREAGRNRVRRLALIGMGAAHGAWQIGLGEAQRMAIRADSRWRDGNFPASDPPSDGLAAARAMAMMTYRSPNLFDERFGRAAQPDATDETFAVASYLRHQGRKLVARFDAGSYMCLTEAMDHHDIQRDRPADVLDGFSAPALCVGIQSDVLYPPEQSRALAERLPGGCYAELASPFGHDAFLVDFDGLNALLRPFLSDSGFFS